MLGMAKSAKKILKKHTHCDEKLSKLQFRLDLPLVDIAEK